MTKLYDEQAIAMIVALVMATQGFGDRSPEDCADVIFERMTGKPLTAEQRGELEGYIE